MAPISLWTRVPSLVEEKYDADFAAQLEAAAEQPQPAARRVAPQLTSAQRDRLMQWTQEMTTSGLCLAAMAACMWPSAAFAEEAAQQATQAAAQAAQAVSLPGLTPAEALLLGAPVLLYGSFSLYRAKINPQAKLSDALFIAAALVVVANILSIIFFKVRLY